MVGPEELAQHNRPVLARLVQRVDELCGAIKGQVQCHVHMHRHKRTSDELEMRQRVTDSSLGTFPLVSPLPLELPPLRTPPPPNACIPSQW